MMYCLVNSQWRYIKFSKRNNRFYFQSLKVTSDRMIYELSIANETRRLNEFYLFLLFTSHRNASE